MEGSRDTWTDERLNDLSRRVDDGFNRVDADLRRFRTEMNARFDGVNARFDGINTRLDALHRLIVQTSGGMIIAVLATLASVVVTHASGALLQRGRGDRGSAGHREDTEGACAR